jgi:exonuclease SbcC
MKILHTGDWHLGAYVGPQCDDPMKRMENTIKCLDEVVETAKKEEPDVILICGDIFHTAKVWADRSNVELRVAADYIKKLAAVAPVAILYGTPNHDSIEMYKNLVLMCSDEANGVWFYLQPELCRIYTNKSGPLQVAGIPGFDKGFFRAKFPGLSAEEENKIFSQELSNIVAGLSAQLDPNIPSVLMAHHTVSACDLDNGQSSIFLQNEVILDTNALDNSEFDLVCLGHIHKAQQIDCRKPVFYSGSLDAFTFNDEGHEKGFWIHNINVEGPYHDFDFPSKYIDTPAREFLTCRWEADLKEYINHGLEANMPVDDTYKDAVVRVLYTCDSDTEKALDKKKLERDLYNAGAYYVPEIRPEKITASVNKESLTEKLTVKECLFKYLDEKIGGVLDPYYMTALPIIEKIQASTPAGSQTGLFLPVEIEVHNYRSYADEKLSFKDIYFAMVNGVNGSGKSSLFMDAIVDCLYEEPREGDLTGWIRNNEKSGSISFTFQLGADTYRVTRTRQKSGKATLSVSKLAGLGAGISYNKDFDLNWEDISCQKIVDTQQKIIDLLGMDANTFRSCVLIMQDQYGKFMEAKPEDRMNVLANLLGLGIYDELEAETKEQLREVNRSIKEMKILSMDLEDAVSQEEPLTAELNNLSQTIQNNNIQLGKLRETRDKELAWVKLLKRQRKNGTQLMQSWTKKKINLGTSKLKLRICKLNSLKLKNSFRKRL